MTQNALPSNFTLRPPTPADLQAVADFITACEIADVGVSHSNPTDLQDRWENPDFDLAQNSWLVTNRDRQIVGYEEVEFLAESGYAVLDGCVHPDFRGKGIGAFLLQTVQNRVQWVAASLGKKLTIHATTPISNISTVSLLENEGFQPVLYDHHMRISLAESPPAPQWANGITLRPFSAGQDEYMMYEAMQAAFQDTWNYSPRPFEEWRKRYDRADFDAGLYFFAMDGDNPVGTLICRQKPEEGWVQGLGVKPTHRKHGIGMALLLHAFQEFYQRGVHTVGLTVDSQDKIGALRLYERAGMSRLETYASYEKVVSAA